MEQSNKKGQLQGRILIVASAIITVIVLFSIYSALVPEAQSAGNQLGDAQRCSDAGGNFNVTQSACLNGTTPADTATVNFSAIPLASIFSSSGIVILLLMVSLFLIVLGVALGRKRR